MGGSCWRCRSRQRDTIPPPQGVQSRRRNDAGAEAWHTRQGRCLEGSPPSPSGLTGSGAGALGAWQWWQTRQAGSRSGRHQEGEQAGVPPHHTPPPPQAQDDWASQPCLTALGAGCVGALPRPALGLGGAAHLSLSPPQTPLLSASLFPHTSVSVRLSASFPVSLYLSHISIILCVYVCVCHFSFCSYVSLGLFLFV